MAANFPNNLDSDSHIREGFICPICMQDCNAVEELLHHFEENHNSEEEKDILQSFKGLFGKAKKILKPENPFEILEKSSSKANEFVTQPHYWEPQELGISKSHWAEFRKIRSNRMDFYAAETNKLIIRLDKIVSHLPSEPGKRREHEQNVVSWVNDEDVKLCPQCAKGFNMLRRKHHCRVCGTVQCHQCSQFLLLSFARKLINPGYEPPPEVTRQSALPPERLTQVAFQALKRTGSNTSLASLTSLIDTSTGEGHIRVCNYCKQLLERREQQMDNKAHKAPIVELYDEMRKHMDKGAELMPVYLKMFDSISQGESTYSLQNAQECRLKLLKTAEYVDAYSKKIQALGLNDERNPTSGIALSLQTKIRLSAINFLKENLLGLPNLPSEEQFAKFQADRRDAIEKRIAYEKILSDKRQAEHKKRVDPALRNQETVSVDRGWGVETSGITSVDDSDDPMLLQIQIIRNYIQQARRDHRYDEVAMLEANLRDLQLEYERMQIHSEN